ncbi:glycine zipper family protein [Persephonella sp.]
MKKLAAAAVTSSLIVSNSFAVDGEILFRDAMFGVGIGATAGLAVYMIDSEDLGKKLGAGVLLGLIGGVVVGFYESSTALVEIDGNQLKIGIPEIYVKDIGEKESKFTYTEFSIFGARF